MLSREELNMLIDENIDTSIVKGLINHAKEEDARYKYGISFDSLKFLLKQQGNENLLNLTIVEAIPAWKKNINLKSKKEDWNSEWLEKYFNKKLDDKYLVKNGKKYLWQINRQNLKKIIKNKNRIKINIKFSKSIK